MRRKEENKRLESIEGRKRNECWRVNKVHCSRTHRLIIYCNYSCFDKHRCNVYIVPTCTTLIRRKSSMIKSRNETTVVPYFLWQWLVIIFLANRLVREWWFINEIICNSCQYFNQCIQCRYLQCWYTHKLCIVLFTNWSYIRISITRWWW